MEEKDGFVDKIKGLFKGMVNKGEESYEGDEEYFYDDYGHGDEYDGYEESYEYEEYEEEKPESQLKIRKHKRSSRERIQIIKPEDISSAQDIVDLLKVDSSVVINLDNLDKDTSRGILDYVQGATYALEGQVQKVNNSIFLAVPYNYEIVNRSQTGNFDTGKRTSWTGHM